MNRDNNAVLNEVFVSGLSEYLPVLPKTFNFRDQRLKFKNL